MQRSFLLLTVAAGILASAGAHAEMMKFAAKLDGAQQVPPITTKGQGTTTATLDTATKTLTYHVVYEGLSGPVRAGHFHGPADVGANAGVAVPLAGPLTSPINGTATLTDSQMKDLEAGKYYVNLHTAADPNGEIRGQMMVTK